MPESAYDGYKRLRFDRPHPRVLRVTLDNPGKKNSIDEIMHPEMVRVWHDISRDDSVAAVILTGAGDAFCAGGNIHRYAQIAAVADTYLGAINPRPGAGEPLTPIAAMVFDEFMIWVKGDSPIKDAKAFGWTFTDFGPEYAATTSGDVDLGLSGSPAVWGSKTAVTSGSRRSPAASSRYRAAACTKEAGRMPPCTCSTRPRPTRA